MKRKQLTAILLTTAMLCGTLAGCGDSREPEKNGEKTTTEKTANDDDIYTVRVWGFGDASSEELKKVSEAISEITREKIGVEVDLYRTIDTEKLNLALTSGEKLDLVCAHNLYQPSLVSTGVLLPLDDLYKEYAPDVAAQVKEEDMKALYLDDQMYFLPQFGDDARASGFAMRKDVAEELGVNPEEIDSMEKMHDVLVQVKDKYPDLYPVVPSWTGGGMQRMFHIDDFCSGLAVLGNAFTEDTTVTSLYETQEWQDFCKTMYQWNKEGLLMPDAATSTDNTPMSTVGFSDFENIVPGKASGAKRDWGQEVVLAQMVEPLKDTERIKGTWCIPAGCENPEKAMELWNLMYTDPEVATLFVYGIEGEHYVYDDTKSFVKYPDGKTNTGYTPVNWAWPNYSIIPLWEGDDPDLYEQLNKFNASAVKSPALGFTFDSTIVTNEVTACQNVIQKYETPLQWGALNPEEAIPAFIKELKAAGLETIQEEAQSQLDDFLSKNK